MGPDGAQNNDDCAGEGQQQIIALLFLVIFIMKIC
jgi:hypothetical protein